jgi:hypothetical protein
MKIENQIFVEKILSIYLTQFVNIPFYTLQNLRNQKSTKNLKNRYVISGDENKFITIKVQILRNFSNFYQ